MAQGDLFRQFVDLGGILDKATAAGVINTEKRLELLSDVYTAELNINAARKKMLQSDTKSLNIFKKLASVANNISDAMKENLEIKGKIKQDEQFIGKLEKARQKEISKGNTVVANALKEQIEQKTLALQLDKVSLQQMRQSIPVLNMLGSAGSFLSDSFAKVGNFFSGGSLIFSGIATIIGGLISIGTTIFNMLLTPLKKAFNVFLEIQSTVGNLAADIGLTASESNGLLNNFADLTLSAMKFGGSMKDVATIFQEFSNTTNKNRFFSEREIEQLTELGLGTGLGVQGASELAASFDNIGISLENTINLTDRARNLAAKYNVNTTKVLKTYQGLVQSLTGIGFGKGLDNLTKLAAKANAIRFDIAESTKSFADAFFDPEKAVEASARMQTLGGKFAASFGDPMQLAFESMSDPTALAEKFASTVSEIAQKDGKGGYFISPADRKMLKIAAETLGQNYEDAVATAIEQKKIADKMTYLSKSNFNLMGMDEGDKLSLAGLMQLNEKGKYEIKMSDGTMQLLENMTDKSQLKAIVDARKKNDDAAIQRQNLAERLSMIVDRVMLGFSNVFTKLFGGTNFESFLQTVEAGGTKIAEFVSNIIKNSGGLEKMVNDVITRAGSLFKTIEELFVGNGPFQDKLMSAIGTLLKGVWDIFGPYLELGIGKIIKAVGVATGFETVQSWGDKMMLNAASKNDTVKSFVGSDEERKKMTDNINKNNDSLSLKQWGAAIGAGLLAGVFTGGFGAIPAAIGAAALVGGGETLYNMNTNEQYVDPSSKVKTNQLGKSYGNFNDGVIYKDGSYAKFSKGDMVQFIDQAAMERASNGYGSGGNMGNGTIQHGGTIIIKSDDGKVVTWDQMYNARDLIGSRISSINKSYENGFGNYQDSNVSPIKPLM
jgi:hypothetical protein